MIPSGTAIVERGGGCGASSVPCDEKLSVVLIALQEDEVRVGDVIPAHGKLGIPFDKIIEYFHSELFIGIPVRQLFPFH